VVRAFFVLFVFLQSGGPPHRPALGREESSARNPCQQDLELIWKKDEIIPPSAGFFAYRSQNNDHSVCLNLVQVLRDAASPSGPGQWLMRFEVVKNNGQRLPLCLPDRGGNNWALAYREGEGATQLTCSRGAYAKCLRLGYLPWRSFKTVSLAPYHQACVFVMRADYLGDGSSHTSDGVAVDISDDLGLLTPSPHALFEGGWDQQGAVCIRDWRLPWTAKPNAASIAFKLRGGFGNKTCSHETAKKKGAIVFSGKFSQSGLLDGPR
jgi:hypothetical protein